MFECVNHVMTLDVGSFLPLPSRRLPSWEQRSAASFHLRGYKLIFLFEFTERAENREVSEWDLQPRKDERDQL